MYLCPAVSDAVHGSSISALPAVGGATRKNGRLKAQNPLHDKCKDYAQRYIISTSSESMPQANLSFVETTDLPLPERIARHKPQYTAKHVPTTDDRYILASNLQKAIRRGLVPNAEATAIRLLAVDPAYTWRRMLVIGFEDIGFGNIDLLHDLLKTFRREALHRELGPARVATYFAHELARACKSRSLCDGLAMLEFSVKRDEYERQYIGLDDDQLLTTACDASSPIMDRIAALRHICGYRVVVRGMYQSGVPASTELMREVCRRLELSEIETRLFMSGQGVSDSLNIPLPMVAQMARGTLQEQAAEQRFQGKNGILYASLDRHCRPGTRCFARLAKEVQPVRQFFARHPGVNPVAAIGAAVFIAEGAVLDRRLVFDGADQLRWQFNNSFLEHAGLAVDDHDELLSLVKLNLRWLNRIRAQEMV